MAASSLVKNLPSRRNPATTESRTASTRPCYGGPANTEGVGQCRAGEQICGEPGWGDCTGEVLPAEEDCAAPGDEDCDGAACGELGARHIESGSFHWN